MAHAVGRLGSELEDAQRRARVASGPGGDQSNGCVGHVQPELDRTTADDRRELFLGERLQLVDLAAGEQRRVHLEVRVLRRRADQRQQAFLHRGQQGILLGLVEAVDLVEEENGATAVCAEPLARCRDHRPHLGHRGVDGGELLEPGIGGGRDDLRERRLAAARRPVEDHRADAVLRDRLAEGRSLAEDLLLADELVERPRPQACGERRMLRHPRRRGLREQVAHAESMLARCSAPRSSGCSRSSSASTR